MKDNLSRSFWLDEALSNEPPQHINKPEKDISADVCIVGGGYTGLWTAIQLKKSEPSSNIVLIEKDLCGSGASGRNAGRQANEGKIHPRSGCSSQDSRSTVP